MAHPFSLNLPALHPSWWGESARKLYRISTAHLMTDFCAGFMLPILPVMAKVLGFGLAETGLLITISSATSSVFQPLWGLFTEHFIRFNYLLFGLVLAIVCIAFIGWSPNYATLALLIGVGYFGVGILHPRAMTYSHALGQQLSAQSGSRSSNLVMSVFITAGTTGFALGPMVSAALVDTWGLMGTVGILPLIGAALVLLVGIDRPFVKILARPRSHRLKAVHFEPGEVGLLALLSGIAIIRATLMVGLDTFMPFVWTEAGHTLSTIGMVMGVSSLAGAVTALYAGVLADRHTEKPVMHLSMWPSLLLYLPLLWVSWESALITQQPWLSYLLFTVVHCTLAFSLTANMVMALRISKRNKSFISGLIAGFSFGVAGLVMTGIGALGESVGLVPSLAVLTLPLLVGCVATCFVPQPLYDSHA